jgi:hypothetical protein
MNFIKNPSKKNFKRSSIPQYFVPPHKKFNCKIRIPDPDIPLSKKLKPVGWEEHRILDQSIDNLLLVGHIEESMSPFASGIIMVRKPDLFYHICIGYRALIQRYLKIITLSPASMIF